MLQKLEITRMAQAMAAHAGARMGVVARNVAQADTPGYKVQDLPDFAETYAAGRDQMRGTRPGHFGVANTFAPPEARVIASPDSVNGNSVSLETEMVKAADIRQQHDMALSVYRSTSDIMKLALGRGR